jgi:hypothetical protein
MTVVGLYLSDPRVHEILEHDSKYVVRWATDTGNITQWLAARSGSVYRETSQFESQVRHGITVEQLGDSTRVKGDEGLHLTDTKCAP